MTPAELADATARLEQYAHWISGGGGPRFSLTADDVRPILSSLRRVEKLGAALRPFGEAADSWDSKTEPVADADVWTLCNPDGDCIPYDFTVGQFRRARQALTGEA